MDAVIARIPLEHRFYLLWTFIGAVLIAATVFATVKAFKTQYVTHTRTVRVARSWGKPDQTIDAAQVNPQLAQLGVTVCDWYGSRKTLVCH